MQYLLIFLSLGVLPLELKSENRRYFTQRESYFQRHLLLYSFLLIKKQNNQVSLKDKGYGLSYRLGGWKSRADIYLRMEKEFLDDIQKVSLIPLIVFPDIESRFPIYFGFGSGLGFFWGESSGLSFEYRTFVGLRWLHLFKKTTGVFFELGTKGHRDSLSEESSNHYYISLGLNFLF